MDRLRTNTSLSRINAITKTTNLIELIAYRPISILPTLTKVYEQIILQKMTESVEKYHLLKET